MKLSYIKFRCTHEQKMTILRRSQGARKNISDYCREQIFNGKVMPVPQLSKEDIAYLQLLTGYVRNFSRLGSLIRNRDPMLLEEIRKLASEMRALSEKLYPR